MVKDLKKVTRSDEKARILAEISQNNLAFALEYMLNGREVLEESIFCMVTSRERDCIDKLKPW